MEHEFRLHKPRVKDFLFMKFDCLKSLIRILSRISKNPSKLFHWITIFFQDYPYVFVLGNILSAIIHHFKYVSYFDSIFIHKIINLPKQLTPAPALHSEHPKVIGIIPDGNRRWAKEHSLRPSQGHFFGASRISDIIRYSIIDPQISHIIIYLLTYDNFLKRSQQEQSAILQLLQSWGDEYQLLHTSGEADFAIIGEPPPDFLSSIPNIPVNPKIRHKDRTQVSLLLCYDGKREIQQAKGNPDDMWIQDDIDFVIRTGFTQRASGFCTYQTSYAEWFFPGIFWPEMSIQTFKHILQDAFQVQQNYGR